jgi:hypothetical protein
MARVQIEAGKLAAIEALRSTCPNEAGQPCSRRVRLGIIVRHDSYESEGVLRKLYLVPLVRLIVTNSLSNSHD